jgi:hypothetical protein
MALFGSDRPVMPSFKTPPELDSSGRSPYDDLNRLERNPDRNNDRNPERRDDRNPERSLSRPDERNEADLRAQERVDRVLDRDGRELDRDVDRNPDRSKDREPVSAAAAPAKASQPILRKSNDGTDPLIQGLFSKLPEPETEWPLAARQKWLQTAANIFDLMYAPNQADAGELAIRVERSAAR